jgi:endonuclease-3
MAPFAGILKRLRECYGKPRPPSITDPLEIILWENVGYLKDDAHRAAAFEALKKRVGTKPKQLLAADLETLAEICRMGGILPELRAPRLRKIAEITLKHFGGDLRPVLKQPFQEAKKALMLFPCIGEPGAEKILMFSGAAPVLSLDSNALRVLLRMGFGEARKNYSASYRAAQEALAGQLPKKQPQLIEAHQLLRQHGKEICKASRPLCDSCPLASDCQYFQTRR